VPFTITGRLSNGAKFGGSDTVAIISAPGPRKSLESLFNLAI